jgi:hypothetical protein
MTTGSAPSASRTRLASSSRRPRRGATGFRFGPGLTVSDMLAELQADILAAIEVPTADVDLASFLKWNSQVARSCGLTGAGPCFQLSAMAPLCWPRCAIRAGREIKQLQARTYWCLSSGACRRDWDPIGGHSAIVLGGGNPRSMCHACEGETPIRFGLAGPGSAGFRPAQRGVRWRDRTVSRWN